MASKQTTSPTQVTKALSKDLPYNAEAEKSVLSAILLDPENLDKVTDVLLAEDFYYLPNQIVFAAILELAEANRGTDLVVLHDYLDSKKLLDKAGGSQYLLELQEGVGSLGLLEHHAKIIKDKSLLRALIQSSSEVISMSYNLQGKTVDDVIDVAEKNVFRLAHNLSVKDFMPFNVLLKSSFQKISEISENQGVVTGVSSGFPSFDTMTSGMQPGDLIILAGRPAMGKTALALNMALSSWKSGAGVGVFSLEMPSEQLVLRMISSESGIDHHKIRTGNISSEEWLELTDTAANLDDAKIFIDDTPSLTLMELRAKARRLKMKQDIKLLIVDYLQLVVADKKIENRTQEIAFISRSLKSLAKELEVPILALSQLSRSLEARMDKRPMLSDLRESGSIEQDADVVCFVYRDVVYNPETDNPAAAEIIIGKQRNGPIGVVHVQFDGATARFAEPEDVNVNLGESG